MKIFILVVVAQLCTALLPGIYSLSHAQSPVFGFEFGKVMSLEKITSDLNEQEKVLKWINVNTTDTTWSVQNNILTSVRGLFN
jgi:hypothetical protein